MVIDEELEDELSTWLQLVEAEGLGAVDEEGQSVLSPQTEEALVNVLQWAPLTECVDTFASAKSQVDEIDASLDFLLLTAGWTKSTENSKVHVDSTLDLLGSIYHQLSERLLRSSALLNLAQDMTGARILLRPALESGVQGAFLLLAVKPKAPIHSPQQMGQHWPRRPWLSESLQTISGPQQRASHGGVHSDCSLQAEIALQTGGHRAGLKQ